MGFFESGFARRHKAALGWFGGLGLRQSAELTLRSQGTSFECVDVKAEGYDDLTRFTRKRCLSFIPVQAQEPSISDPVRTSIKTYRRSGSARTQALRPSTHLYLGAALEAGAEARIEAVL